MEFDQASNPSFAERHRWLMLFALLVGNVALAFGPWLVRIADTGPVSAGFWRVFLALPFVMLISYNFV